jgi:hypothetical protein
MRTFNRRGRRRKPEGRGRCVERNEASWQTCSSSWGRRLHLRMYRACSDRERDHVCSITIFESRELMDFQEYGEHDDIGVQEGIHDELDYAHEVSDKTAF